MIIPFMLNGEKLYLDARPGDRLLHMLRQRFDLAEVKESCSSGVCGTCTVLMNGVAVPSCVIPAFQIRNCEIVTLSYFKKTEDYGDIEKGFSDAGVSLCGFCDSSKILTAYSIIAANDRPNKQEIREMLEGISCRCTAEAELVAAVQKSAAFRRKRLS